MTKIDFKDIRTHKGSQDKDLKNYAVNLHHLRKYQKALFFVANGAGGDGGVECYWRLPNGNEKAWQAKYFPDGLGDSQWKQIDDSVKQPWINIQI
jgi:hypothetical protein